MSSVVAICNIALSNIGKQNIEDLSDPNAEARVCRQFYDHVRDMLLQAYPWRFAGKTSSMAEVVNDNPGGWRYAYRRPTDCLKVRWLRTAYSLGDPCPQSQQIELSHRYDIEGSTIYCDLSPAFLRYTFSVTDPTRFPSLFVEAFGWHLATRIAMPLTRDPRVRADCYNLAISAQGAAEMADANEVRETSDHETEFVSVRS